MSPSPSGPWMDRPLAGAFLAFNLLPVDLLHTSRCADWQLTAHGAETDESMDALNAAWRARRRRHVSMALLRQFDADEVVLNDFKDPALPVFMAPAAVFERLALFCGLVCLVPSIRKVITREELQILRGELSAQEFDFARTGGTRWVPVDPGPPLVLSLGQVRAQAHTLGEGVLFSALASASTGVACRARLRWPASPSPDFSTLPPGWRDGDQALALARGLLQELDAEWMSLFPASR